jgi:pyrimidine-nucleoside phosphorylase
MIVQDIIRRKRYDHRLSRDEIEFMVSGYTHGHIPDYQMAALLMAICCRGMDEQEIDGLLTAMVESGQTLDLSTVPGIKVDKHGLGGTAQPVSVILAPLVAATGVLVPMLSGRGMGHTRATLDHLETVPGFRAFLRPEEFVANLRDIGLFIGGATEEIVPADRKLLALRAVTGTVESIPLVAASIMSKKLAEGTDRLVVDVKMGRGAFMQTYEEALALSETLVSIGTRKGMETIVFITDMDQPLGYAVGAALEMREAVEILRGREQGVSKSLREVVLVLGEAMLLLGGKARTRSQARATLERVIAEGRAFDKLKEMVTRQGGDTRVLENPDLLPQARWQKDIVAPTTGYIQHMDALEIGWSAVALGAGRQRIDAEIDRSAGFVLKKKRGHWVEAGETLAIMHFNEQAGGLEAEQRFLSACIIGPNPPSHRPLIKNRVDRGGVTDLDIYPPE